MELIKLHNSQALHESTRWMKHPWLKVKGRNKYIKIREKKFHLNTTLIAHSIVGQVETVLINDFGTIFIYFCQI